MARFRQTLENLVSHSCQCHINRFCVGDDGVARFVGSPQQMINHHPLSKPCGRHGSHLFDCWWRASKRAASTEINAGDWAIGADYATGDAVEFVRCASLLRNPRRWAAGDAASYRPTLRAAPIGAQLGHPAQTVRWLYSFLGDSESTVNTSLWC